MLNKKALKAAEGAFFDCHDDAPFSTPTKIGVAIEAYLAALPDDGLVEEARVEAGVWEGETEPTEANPEVLTKLLNRLADALEGARAKNEVRIVSYTRAAAPEISDG